MRQKEAVYWFGLLALSIAMMCGLALMSYGLVVGVWSFKYSVSHWPVLKIPIILTVLTHFFSYYTVVAKRYYGVRSGLGPLFVMVVALVLGLVFPIQLLESWDRHLILTALFAISGLHYLGALLIEEEIQRIIGLE